LGALERPLIVLRQRRSPGVLKVPPHRGRQGFMNAVLVRYNGVTVSKHGCPWWVDEGAGHYACSHSGATLTGTRQDRYDGGAFPIGISAMHRVRLWFALLSLSLLLSLSTPLRAQMSIHIIQRSDAAALVPIISPLLPEGGYV